MQNIERKIVLLVLISKGNKSIVVKILQILDGESINVSIVKAERT